MKINSNLAPRIVRGKGTHGNLAPQNPRGKGTHVKQAARRRQNLLRLQRCH